MATIDDISGDSGEKLKFPITFDLRVIYLIEGDMLVEADAARILSECGARASAARRLPTDSLKYRRLAIPVTFLNRDSLHDAYAELGKLPYIKAVM